MLVVLAAIAALVSAVCDVAPYVFRAAELVAPYVSRAAELVAAYTRRAADAVVTRVRAIAYRGRHRR